MAARAAPIALGSAATTLGAATLDRRRAAIVTAVLDTRPSTRFGIRCPLPCHYRHRGRPDVAS
jgi:hypothetical protein